MLTKDNFSLKRAPALDALRGIAILLMILSGSIPFGNALPAWMYHAQVPPPLHIFNPNLPGITWVDIVFPFFIFSMGAAFPFAMRKKLEKGIPSVKILLDILIRALLLAGFAIFIEHIRPSTIGHPPHLREWILGIAGFIIVFMILARLPLSLNKYFRWGIKIAGLIAAIIMLSMLRYPNGTGFQLNRSDIIILLLANTAFAGSIIWFLTRDNILMRIGFMGLFLAMKLAHTVPGSWNSLVWDTSPFPWLYGFSYMRYIFIALPGSIAGDMIYNWLNNKEETSGKTGIASSNFILISIVMFALVVTNIAGLFARQIALTWALDIVLLLSGYYLFKNSATRYENLLRQLFSWGTYWLILGLVFEAYEGGIKKDEPTMSYYFVTSGLAIFTYIILSIITDYYKKAKYINTIIENGQNPMIAYSAGGNLVMPLLGITAISPLLNYVFYTPWLGFIKGCILTALVAIATSIFTKKRLFLRT
jgi:predicted acyltransferase